MKGYSLGYSKANNGLNVLIATYNGAEYLNTFIYSVLSQTEQADIIIRDDGSCDGTAEIIHNYGGRVRIITDNYGNVGVLENFNILMKGTDSRYIAFADQDDIWEADKLQVELDLMQHMEERYGSDTPILVHCDLAVCDSGGEVQGSSLWRFQGLKPHMKSFSHFLVQNNVTGCTVVINNALKEKAFPVPQEAVMHDWWLALVASAAGKIGYVQRPLVRYRQHGGNQVGAVRDDVWGALRRLRAIDPRDSLRATQRQAKAFCDRFSGVAGMEDAVELAAIYSEIRAKGYPQRVMTLCRHGFWKQSFLRNLGLVFFI